MNKTVISAFFLLGALAAAGASADTPDIPPLIITDNFVIADPGDSELKSLSGPELGSLGDKVVVYGQKSPEHLAFVKNADGNNYVITDKILVQCAKGIYCIPAGAEVSRISESVYEITVPDYDGWQVLMDELSTADGVRQISPSYEHGLTPTLQ